MYRYFCRMTHSEFRRMHINKLAAIGYEMGEARAIWNLWCEEELGLSRTQWEMRANEIVTKPTASMTQGAWLRMAAGEPIQHVMGRSWFRGLELKVSPDVLIPRPETETLVELALKRVPQGAHVLDVGTGSGCIAIGLKHARPDIQMSALDVSEQALDIARHNAQHHGLDIEFLTGDLAIAPPSMACDVLISNPPYIPVEESDTLAERVVQHEPSIALFSPDGQPNGFYKRLAEWGMAMLPSGGMMFLETHHELGKAVVDHLRSGAWKEVTLREDDCGKPRFIIAQRP